MPNSSGIASRADEGRLHKMNRAQKAITGLFLSLALLAPTIASAVTLSVYESARSDPAKQSRIFHEAYSTAVSKIATQLGSSTSADGVKTPQRLENDGKLADVVDEIAAHPTDAQADALIVMIKQYAAVQPSTELEDLIAGFLLTEAKKQIDSATAPTPPKSAAPAGASSNPMIIHNRDGTFTIQKEPLNGTSKDSNAGNGLVIPPQVVTPLIPAVGKKLPGRGDAGGPCS
jgi:hypothetical protein